MNPTLPDGITDGSNTIQGVRSYDSAIGSWTTPDAFAGEVGDPMSQKSYMWNRNNPAVYSDPTGFDALQSFLNGVVGVADQLSFGIGPALRDAMGTNSYVNTSDSAYGVGSKVGFAATMLGGGEAKAAEEAIFVGRSAGESIAARSAARSFTNAERTEINKIGAESGCHTCGSTSAGTRSGNFVPDHQPPSSLNAANSPQKPYPQCLTCSRAQGLAIARRVLNEIVKHK